MADSRLVVVAAVVLVVVLTAAAPVPLCRVPDGWTDPQTVSGFEPRGGKICVLPYKLVFEHVWRCETRFCCGTTCDCNDTVHESANYCHGDFRELLCYTEHIHTRYEKKVCCEGYTEDKDGICVDDAIHSPVTSSLWTQPPVAAQPQRGDVATHSKVMSPSGTPPAVAVTSTQGVGAGVLASRRPLWYALIVGVPLFVVLLALFLLLLCIARSRQRARRVKQTDFTNQCYDNAIYDMPVGLVTRGGGAMGPVTLTGDKGRPPIAAPPPTSDKGRPPMAALPPTGDKGRPPMAALPPTGDKGSPPWAAQEKSGSKEFEATSFSDNGINETIYAQIGERGIKHM